MPKSKLKNIEYLNSWNVQKESFNVQKESFKVKGSMLWIALAIFGILALITDFWLFGIISIILISVIRLREASEKFKHYRK